VLKEFNNAYYVLHKYMGYEGIKSAKAVIKWIIDSKKD